MLLFLISLASGALTILTPCILPLLPIVVGGSLSDGKVKLSKALVIVSSLGFSVIAFTLLLKASTVFIDIPESTWKILSGGLIAVLGFIFIFPNLWSNKWLAKLSAKSNILLGKGSQKQNVLGDILVGAALGPVFSTCSPTYFIVLATVLPARPAVGIVYLLAFAFGLCTALLLVALVGQKVMDKLNIAADPKGWFKRGLGILFILVGLAIILGVDKKIETALINADIFDATKIEQKLLGLLDEDKPMEENLSTGNFLTLEEKKGKLTPAKEISSPDHFINTDGQPITIEGLRGKKVILLDVWTYSCINCQRTIPYLNAWYDKYSDQGLEIIGLHTPEFSFEQLPDNVAEAVKKFGIRYPVVLDNDYSTWNDYGNRYWPRKYLIDIDGYIVYDHIGEGAYDETEQAIIQALKEKSERLGDNMAVSEGMSTPTDVIEVDSSKVRSPEIYFGSDRNKDLGNAMIYSAGLQTLVIPEDLKDNKLYLGGQWIFSREYAQNKSEASIVFNYEAKNVYMVASSENPTEVEILLDGKSIKKITVQEEGLYQIINGGNYDKHKLEIKIKEADLKAFTFTFG